MTKTGTAPDPVADFETPTRKQTTLVEESPNMPMAVRDGFALVRFVKPHFDRDKDDHPFIAFEFLLPLTDEHRAKDVLPEEILSAWDALTEHELKSVSPSSVDGRAIELRAAPDLKDHRLVVKFAEVEKVVISVVVEKGTGEEREITRLHFRLSIELTDETLKYAGTYFGKDVWLRMVKTQGKLKL